MIQNESPRDFNDRGGVEGGGGGRGDGQDYQPAGEGCPLRCRHGEHCVYILILQVTLPLILLPNTLTSG